MKRSKKIALTVATILMVAGLALSVGAMASVGFDLTRLNTTLQIADGPDGPVTFGIFFGGS